MRERRDSANLVLSRTALSGQSASVPRATDPLLVVTERRVSDQIRPFEDHCRIVWDKIRGRSMRERRDSANLVLSRIKRSMNNVSDQKGSTSVYRPGFLP